MTTRILVPPGIGDIYWTLVKLPAFLKKHGLTDPELTTVSYPDERGGHLRGLPYLKLFDWIKIGNPPSVPNDPNLQDIWDEAYNGPGRSIIPGVQGFDYLIAYNGRVNSGGYIENDELECDWHPRMSINTKVTMLLAATSYREQLDPYVVMFWPFYGSYSSHLEQFPLPLIIDTLQRFLNEYSLTPVFIGSEWDIPLNPLVADLKESLPRTVDLTGKLSLAETLGLIYAARVVTGYHAGITNLAAAMHLKTILLWDNRYPESTAMAVVSPEARNDTYHALFTAGLTPERYLERLALSYEN